MCKIERMDINIYIFDGREIQKSFLKKKNIPSPSDSDNFLNSLRSIVPFLEKKKEERRKKKEERRKKIIILNRK